MQRRGRFITFEGPEGSGKTTHARQLVRRLEAAGRAVLHTREPGGTPVGEAIRGILRGEAAGDAICAEAEVFLFAASRSQLVRSVILPALERGVCVVCDRFADSTTVYQGVARGLGIERMLALNEMAVGAAVPDVTVLLDIDVEKGFARLRERYRGQSGAPDRIERAGLDFHRRVREGYLDLARRWPGRFRIVNADGDVEAVDADIWRAVEGVLG